MLYYIAYNVNNKFKLLKQYNQYTEMFINYKKRMS